MFNVDPWGRGVNITIPKYIFQHFWVQNVKIIFLICMHGNCIRLLEQNVKGSGLGSILPC